MQNYLPTDYQNFIALSRYARWKDDEQRRETWSETVDRYFDYMANHLKKKHGYILTKALREKLDNSILALGIMPSMRALMTAGVALDRCHVAGYNCSYIPVDSPRSFDECMYILMCGTGVGFSVERENVDKLPTVNEHFEDSTTVITVADSRPGWARALRELIAMLYVGQIPSLDVSQVRPAGARLKTFGGRASGPQPLIDLYNFCIAIFKKAAGRRLYPIECHDIMCKIGEVVVVGGVRRSALISLSNLNDDQMRHAKSGSWWENEGHRALANNSVAYKGKPDMGTFMREWLALYESKSGERGIFNRKSAKKKVEENGRRKPDQALGCNPCSEIRPRPYQFCNLTEVVAREPDDLNSLKEKVRLATILGTLQSTLTEFKYLRKAWKQNPEEERLLGVSLTGILDCPILSTNNDSLEDTLEHLRHVAVELNLQISKVLDVPQSTAITCIKPSGTVSQLVDSASGIHARHNPFYIRTVRGDNKDPLTQFMKEAGIPIEPDITKPDSVSVFSFPMKSPKGAITRTEMTAIEQLDYWLTFQRHWCEHKPSVTVSVKENEWMEVGAWVYENFDEVSGISFLPFSEHTYKQAPYQDIDENEYNELMKTMPKAIDWSKLQEFEKEDTTNGSKELACTAGVCEVVDIEAT
ncbi:putative adenosylcobalamin-dependent ribonucleoside-triphosphate reductase [uncultured virus]|uniref:ribonucleoside-triphosphate reductase (thioredoxin) n=1 Tax=uncultured virus TaxID=340016 RepID=A0A218MKU5_9VIRU|nr:putative adenosylcobalamin-dependent ribonucleoside-triphosphate reductase [uncultured virus]